MKASLFILLFLTSTLSMAQEKAYDMALSYGAYSSPSFKQNTSKDYFSADFDYHLSKRFTLSSGFLTGKFNYFEDVRSSSDPGVIISTSGKTNARGSELHGYAMAKYAIIKGTRFTVQLGAGAGFFNQRLQFPYQNATGNGYTESSFTELAFPVSAEVYYLLANRIGVGIKAGGFIEPDFPIVGTHIGPQVRVRL